MAAFKPRPPTSGATGALGWPTAAPTRAMLMAVRTTPAAVLPDVCPLLVAPDESVRSGHLVDDGMTFAEGVGAGMTSLGFAATHVPAGGAQAKVEPTAAFLAPVGLGFREIDGYVVAVRGGAGEPAEDVHAPTVDRPARADCAMGYAGPPPEGGTTAA